MMRKLHVDFYSKLSMGRGMVNRSDEIDSIKVRTGLFAVVTARLEDAHEIAAKGHSRHLTTADARIYIRDLRSILDEIEIQQDAVELIW